MDAPITLYEHCQRRALIKVIKSMYGLLMLAIFGLGTFLVAWVVNGLVGILSGEKPRDTGRLWVDIFLRLFVVLELGLIGRALNYVGLKGRFRKIFLFVGLLCVLLFLVRGCRHAHADRTYIYPSQSHDRTTP